MSDRQCYVWQCEKCLTCYQTESEALACCIEYDGHMEEES